MFGKPDPNGHRHLVRGIQVDHVVPLWRVRVDAQQHRWPDVLRFWGPRNLQTLSSAGHQQKTAQEARDRAALVRTATPAQLSMLPSDFERVDLSADA